MMLLLGGKYFWRVPETLMRIKVGDRVKIKNNRHPDVLAGTEGVIDCFHEGGYGVSIHGRWMVAGGDRGQTYESTEVVWYESHEFELV